MLLPPLILPDWKHIDFISVPNATVGCDFAGTVVDIGSKVTKSLKPGDRVAGVVHGVSSNSLDNGSFGEYCVAKGDILLKVPDAVSDEQAATLGVGISTIGQGLYQSLELPMPDQPAKEPFPVLIYGARYSILLSWSNFLVVLRLTSMKQHRNRPLCSPVGEAVSFSIPPSSLSPIQQTNPCTKANTLLSNLRSGLTVIGTSSPRNFDLVKSYGADAVFDYSDPETCAKNIREYTNNSLKYAFDCISEHSSPQVRHVLAFSLSSPFIISPLPYLTPNSSPSPPPQK